MKFALINNIKTEASKGARGECPQCGSVLIAKCGTVKIPHWAHKNLVNCDQWWERETEWHRSWKNKFPERWQEVVFFNKQKEERHIADVHTEHGLVIEFQHSFLEAQERNSREEFYENLVWVVDGTRLKRDYHRYLRAKNKFKNTSMPKIYAIEGPEDCFHFTWLQSTVPVIFDFLGNDIIGENIQDKKLLYCLFPKSIGANRIVAELTREAFINSIIQGKWPSRVEGMMKRINNSEERRLNELAKEQEYIAKAMAELYKKRPRPSSIRRGRRRPFW